MVIVLSLFDFMLLSVSRQDKQTTKRGCEHYLVIAAKLSGMCPPVFFVARLPRGVDDDENYHVWLLMRFIGLVGL